MTGVDLFGVGTDNMLREMVTMAGYMPSGWKAWWDTQSYQCPISPSVADVWWEKRKNSLLRHGMDLENADAIVALLKRVLVLDPAARPTAPEVLQDPWFLYCATSMESALKTKVTSMADSCRLA